MNKIYCFHKDLGRPDLNETVHLWESIWSKHGWIPVVMTEGIAAAHPLYDKLLKKAEAVPTVNGRSFSTVNFIRWCAFAQIKEGVVTDYDVLPRVPAYPPQDYGDGLFCGDPSGGPGWVAGTQDGFESILNRMLEYKPTAADNFEGRPHVCDMMTLQRNKDVFTKIDPIVLCYGTLGWRDKPLVHFGNSYMRTGLPKAQEIKDVLKEEGAIYE